MDMLSSYRRVGLNCPFGASLSMVDVEDGRCRVFLSSRYGVKISCRLNWNGRVLFPRVLLRLSDEPVFLNRNISILAIYFNLAINLLLILHCSVQTGGATPAAIRWRPMPGHRSPAGDAGHRRPRFQGHGRYNGG
jgi:hypothetical protein